jgi:hypothetical protein
MTDDTRWEPPATMDKDALVELSNQVLGRPDIPFTETEHIFRVNALEMDWDVGVMVYEPEDPSLIPVGADGNKVGMFVLAGGSGDYRAMEQLTRLIVRKFGYRITTMTYPGRLYLSDPSRDWPGDTISADGAVRTPIWQIDEFVSPDEYDLIVDESLRARYGRRMVARAKPGSRFYDRMAAWPAAFEAAMKTVCRDHLPEGEFSIYVHGHSTGGPFVHLLTQRVANVRGVVGIENSPFGYMFQKMVGYEWDGPFNDLLVRTWRDIARYRGAEVRSEEGEQGLMRLPWIMEDVFEDWEKTLTQPQFKAEYPLHYAADHALEAAARAAAARLELNEADTAALVKQYIGYGYELSGPDVKPVPPILLSICKHSRDHTEKVYDEIVLPTFAAMDPAPKVRLTKLGTGSHHYEYPEEGLPEGLVGPITGIWHDAIMKGYYLAN